MNVKYLFTAFLLVLSLFTLEGHTIERTYIATDKSCYVAGDNVWCSAFCLDASTGKLSELSRTLYVELHSAQGMAQTMKIALDHGRGAGLMKLSRTLPTGCYKLIAYTAQNLSEKDFGFEGGRIISVFNVFSSERVDGGVEIVEDVPLQENPVIQSSLVSVDAPSTAAPSSRIVLNIANRTAVPVSMSVSVHHRDALPSVSEGGLEQVADALGRVGEVTFSEGYIPDYEGEIIRARLEGEFDADSLTGQYAFISLPGSGADIYCSQIDSLGGMAFFTSNIYGDRELICDLPGKKSFPGARMRLVSPFVNVPCADIPVLKMTPSMSEDILGRGVSMQIENRFASDTLFEVLQGGSNILFDERVYRYVLDDYTRFPLMEEVIVEYVKELRARRTPDGRRDIQVRVDDAMNGGRFVKDNSLMLVDGVPVFDHEKIYSYDPLLVKYLDIYPSVFYVGYRQFGGIANFITYKGDLPSLELGDNVSVLDFQGVSYPMAYTCEGIDRTSYPDFRRTIYWHPLLGIDGGCSFAVNVETPSYTGIFDVTVEGITAEGKPFRCSNTFEVR